MIALWTLAFAPAEAQDIDCRAFGRQRPPPAVSWFDEPNTDPWPGLTVGGDTATFPRLARTLELGRLPPPGSVRPEELVQAMPTDAPPPDRAQELAVRVEVAESPWERDAALVLVTLTARRARLLDRAPAHLVVVVDEDVQQPDTLTVAREALAAVLEGLRHDDEVAVVASGGARVLLPPTRADALAPGVLDGITPTRDTDLPAALDAAWAMLAEVPRYDLRRVLLVSDGQLDLLTQSSRLVGTSADNAAGGVGMVGLGFGEKHGRDDSVEAVVHAAGGPVLHLSYPLDGAALADHLGAVLEPAATDVRALVEWDPRRVVGVHRVGRHLDRLTGIGPKGRSVGRELGVGQTASVLYEVRLAPGARAGELGTVTVHDRPDFGGVREREVAVPAVTRSFDEATADFRIAAAAAALGEVLAGTQAHERVVPEHVAELTRRAARPEYELDQQLVEMAERAAVLLRARTACLAKKD